MPEVPGTCTEASQFPEVEGIVAQSYVIHRSSELVKNVLHYPCPGYYGHWRTTLPDVPDAGMNVVQNFQEFRVWV